MPKKDDIEDEKFDKHGPPLVPKLIPFRPFTSAAGTFWVTGAILRVYDELRADKGILGPPIAEAETVDHDSTLQRFEGGTIYSSKEAGTWEVYGAILDEYVAAGGVTSYLGHPTSHVVELGDGGVFSAFQGGWIFWWSWMGAVAFTGVRVSFTGFRCNHETDDWSASDEVFILLSAVGLGDEVVTRSRVFENVDEGESHTQRIDLLIGAPSAIALSATVVERDSGNPDEYLKLAKLGTVTAKKGATAAIAYLWGPVAGFISEVLAETFAEDVTSAVNSLFDTGDETLGTDTIPISLPRLVRSAMEPGKKDGDVIYTIQSGEIAGDSGRYVVYFNTELIKDDTLIDLPG